MGIMSRMVPSTILATAIPDMKDRGAFMSINSSLQQMAGGIIGSYRRINRASGNKINSY